MAVGAMASQFSNDCKYFAQFSSDGKLQVWETKDNKFQQEFTPDFHLTSPCTCLHFVQQSSLVNKNGSPKKKMRRHSMDNSSPTIALGTRTGLLFMYSIAKGDVLYSIDSKTSQSVSCLSWQEGDVLYSALDQFVVSWNLGNRTVQSKWKTGNENITAILILPDSETLLTASRNIKLWNVRKKEAIKTFTGHSSQVTILQYIKPSESVDSYFLSGAKGDRLLSCWNLNVENSNNNAVANFVMEDVALNVSYKIGTNGTTNLAAVTRSGVVHVYKHTLNGKCGKPLKPKTTIQIASDNSENKSTIISPIPVINVAFKNDASLMLCHGFLSLLVFEDVEISEYEKVQCLIRKDLRKSSQSRSSDVTNLKAPVVDRHVQYLTPNASNTTKSTVKRKNEPINDVPMELRLENLTLSKTDAAGVPKSNNMSQLLVQGLHSKDKDILRTVLSVTDEQVIKNTVSRLAITAIVPLVNELNNYIRGKTARCNIGILWLKHIMNVHAGILLSNPELSDIIGPVLSGIENRLTLFNPLNSLKGRLELLVTQLTVDSQKEVEDEPFLVFNDKESSDSELEGMEIAAHSESENEWDEDSSEEEEHRENNVDSDEMSS